MKRSTPTRFTTPLATDVYTRSTATSPSYSLSPRSVIIPTISPTSSKKLKRGQQRHTRLTLVARRGGLVNLHGLSPSALPRYRDRDHWLSLSLSLVLFNRSRPRVSAFPRVQSSGRLFPRRGSWKTSPFQPSNRGVIRYSCRSFVKSALLCNYLRCWGGLLRGWEMAHENRNNWRRGN